MTQQHHQKQQHQQRQQQQRRLFQSKRLHCFFLRRNHQNGLLVLLLVLAFFVLYEVQLLMATSTTTTTAAATTATTTTLPQTQTRTTRRSKEMIIRRRDKDLHQGTGSTIKAGTTAESPTPITAPAPGSKNALPAVTARVAAFTNATSNHGHRGSRSAKSGVGIYAKSATHSSFTILVDCMGEMGNYMHHIAHGYGLQQLAQDPKFWKGDNQNPQGGLLRRSKSHLVLRKRPGSGVGKGKKALQYLMHCFPSIQRLLMPQGPSSSSSSSSKITVALGHPESVALEQLYKIQKEWLGAVNASRLNVNRPFSLSDTKELFHYVQELIQDAQFGSIPPPASLPIKSTATITTTTTGDPETIEITFPIIRIQRLEHFPLLDYYWDDYQRLFQINETRCCRERPFPQEVVYHFRNFAGELHDHVSYGRGHQELNPDRTASDLFGHLKPGNQIAMTTRFATHPTTLDYVHALQSKGLQVRVITGSNTTTTTTTTITAAARTTHTKNQKTSYTSLMMEDDPPPPSDDKILLHAEAVAVVKDFCFLTRTQKELVGNHASTFLIWAGLLTNATTVRIYGVRHPIRYPEMIYGVYNWTHPNLTSKIRYEFYPPSQEEEDEEEEEEE